jgi:hypothetical protein
VIFYRIYLIAQRDGFDFNLAFIPKSFTRELREPFETAYMNALFQVGYDLAAKGYPWAKAPPGFTAPAGPLMQPAAQNWRRGTARCFRRLRSTPVAIASAHRP